MQKIQGQNGPKIYNFQCTPTLLLFKHYLWPYRLIKSHQVIRINYDWPLSNILLVSITYSLTKNSDIPPLVLASICVLDYFVFISISCIIAITFCFNSKRVHIRNISLAYCLRSLKFWKLQFGSRKFNFPSSRAWFSITRINEDISLVSH